MDKLDVNVGHWDIDLVETKEFMSLLLECMASDGYKEATADRTPEYRSGAMWGIAYAAAYANSKARHYGARLEDTYLPGGTQLYYPCNYCGSCPVWLAAYEAPGLETSGDVIEACKARKCPLVNQPVSKEVLNG